MSGVGRSKPQASTLRTNRTTRAARPAGRPACDGARGALAGALLAALAAVPLVAGAESSGLPDLTREAQALVDTPGGARGVLGGLFNPGAWAVQRAGGAYLAWEELADSRRERWTAVAATRGLGLGWRRLQLNAGPTAPGSLATVDEYTVGFSAGDRSAGFGLGYTWAAGERGVPGVQRDDRLAVGAVRRWPVASIGVTSLWSLERDDHLVAGDLGIRPLGARVTLFGDVTYQKGDASDDLSLGYGARVEALPGLSLAAKALDTGEVTVGVSVGWGPRQRLAVRQHLDDGGDRLGTTYALEWGPAEPDLFATLSPARRSVMPLELAGPMSYRRYRLLDSRRTLLGTLAQLARAGADRRVRAVAVNLSGMRVPLELQWELRRQLAGLRAQGKVVVAYVDRAGLFETMLASVADQVWLDPYGSLQLLGMASGRTYYKDAAAKLGIGVEELRFFTYKSAMEGYARSEMSDAEREQRQALLDDLYETVVTSITTARGISRARWDRLVDEQGMLLAQAALGEGLVDSLGSWDRALLAARTAQPRAATARLGEGAGSADDVAAGAAGGGPAGPGVGASDAAPALSGVLGDPIWSSLAWGEPARVAIVYAVGATEMDSGMNGRRLARELKRAREDRRVKAVVLRADSPGGDPLASDVVAREMAATAKRKPVVVSQGQVAASGGYWISLEALRIVSAPVTVTGSIGVIAGHAWNDSLGRKLGLNYDGVKRGEHADLYQGIRLPLTSQPLPDRPLTAFERRRAEQVIREMYGEFVDRVAKARRLQPAYVDSMGQGRVWSGTRAQRLGLVDDLGGLWDALRVAKGSAGLAADAPIALDEVPRLGWFNFDALRPNLLLLDILAGAGRASADLAAGGDAAQASAGGAEGAQGADAEAGVGPDASLQFLQAILRQPGAPLLRMEPFAVEGGGAAGR